MKKYFSLLTLVLIATLLLSSVVYAGTEASDYLDNYSAGIVPGRNGVLKIAFTVTGTGRMEDIGALTIILYEVGTSKDTKVATYTYTDSGYEYLLAHDTGIHGTSVSYNGVSGRSYVAEVTVWAGKNGKGDYRVITTDVVKATS